MDSESVPRWGTKRRCLSGLNMWNEDSYSVCILKGWGVLVGESGVSGRARGRTFVILMAV